MIRGKLTTMKKCTVMQGKGYDVVQNIGWFELWAKHSRRRLSRGGAKDSNDGLYGADVQILVETEGLDCIAPLRWLNGPLLQYCLEQYWIKGWHWDIAARLAVRGQNCTKLGWNAQIRDILFTESSFVKEMMRHSGMTNTAVLNRRNDKMEWKQCKKRWKGGVHCTQYSDLTGYTVPGTVILQGTAWLV